jgi:nucleoside 2-deoxyribosyltransferase
MKVYLASRYSLKETMLGYARELRDMGVEVTSRWLAELYAANTTLDQVDPEELCGFAVDDLEDIREADAFIFFSEKDATPRGGRHVEFGYALALGTPIMVVGPYENIFHYLPGIKQVDTWGQAKASL